MHRCQLDVCDFHALAGQLSNTRPQIPAAAITSRQHALIREEVKELLAAISDDDLVEIADGVCDLLYVLYGVAEVYGIDLEPCWNIVHSFNMRKAAESPGYAGTEVKGGKLVKPSGWVPPQAALKEELLRQGMKA